MAIAILPLGIIAQTTDKNKPDTVYLFKGEIMSVDVKKISRDSVIYTEVGKTHLKKINKDNVRKIKYNYGKVEVLNTNPPEEKPEIDWRKVKVVKDKSQVSGLTEVQKIEATAKGSGRGYETPKTLHRKAIVVLRKKAANLNANYVLITKESVSAAFGEIPSVSLSAIAYSDK
jgi:hypothetical protein